MDANTYNKIVDRVGILITGEAFPAIEMKPDATAGTARIEFEGPLAHKQIAKLGKGIKTKLESSFKEKEEVERTLREITVVHQDPQGIEKTINLGEYLAGIEASAGRA